MFMFRRFTDESTVTMLGSQPIVRSITTLFVTSGKLSSS
jgi:hypothetical protein